MARQRTLKGRCKPRPKNLSSQITGWLSLLSLLVSIQTYAANGEIEFQKGNAAFKQGQLTEALTHYLRAEAAGFNSPQLNYNLGTVYYRLGHYESAEQYFLAATDNASSLALVHFNLGLVATKQNQFTDALRWFEKARIETADPALQQAARKMSDRVRGELAALNNADKAPTRFSMLSSYVGFEDKSVSINENQGATDNGNRFVEILGSIDQAIAGTLDNGFAISGFGFLQANDPNSDLNFGLIEGGASYQNTWSTASIRLSGSASETNFDGAPYESNYETAVELGFAAAWFKILGRYSFGYVSPHDDLYAYNEGTQHKTRLALSKSVGGATFAGQYDWEYNDREDISTPTEFTSTSPIRNAVSLKYRQHIGKKWNVSSRYEYRITEYKDANRTTTTVLRRKETRNLVKLETGYSLSNSVSVGVGYQFTTNESNVDVYDYDRHMIALQLTWLP